MSFFRKSKKKKEKSDGFDGHAQPPVQEEYYSEIEAGTPSAGQSETMKRKRASNFMEKPEDGWQHDDRGIGAGLGVYFTFPVVYVGAIVMPQSISSARHEAQTEITREAIALCCDESIPSRAYVKRGLSMAAKQYAYGNVEPMMFDVKLSVSATGIIIAPASGDDDGIIGFYPMRNISLATGGEDLDYDFVSFTARDQDTGVRESHVFDCGMQSDDVMTTLGQAFTMAQELQAKRREQGGGADAGRSAQGYFDVAPNEALAPPPGAEALYGDIGGFANPMYGQGMSANDSPAYFDVKPSAGAAGYDVGHASEPQYDTAGMPAQGGGASTYFDVRPDPIGKEMFAAYSKGGGVYSEGVAPGKALADALNQNDTYMMLSPDKFAAADDDDADATYLGIEPSWTAYDPQQVEKRVDVSAFKGQRQDTLSKNL
eukprot:m.352411 g.352411  ORF g.352411 m.352411 type:complete len:429 (-) comp20709_c0_seq1:208-1494(-)